MTQLMEKQRVARQAALVKQLECGCPDSTCADGKTCSHPMRRITAAKGEINSSHPSSSSNSRPPSSADNNQVSSTTGSGSMLLTNSHTPRVYTRDSRNHHGATTSHGATNSTNTPPLVLSLSQIQGGGGLLILNSNSQASNNSAHKSLVTPVSVASFVCSTSNSRGVSKNDNHKNAPLVLKQEAMDTNCCPQNVQATPNGKIISQRDAKMEVTNDGLRQSMFEGMTYSRQDRNVNHHSEIVMSSAPSTPSKQMDTSHEDDFKHQNYGDTVVLLGKRFYLFFYVDV